MKKILTLLVFLVIFGGIAAGGYTLFKDTDGPTIALSPDTGRLSPVRDVTLTLEDAASGVRSVSVILRKGSQTVTVLEQAVTPVEPRAVVTFNLKESGVKDGEAELEIRATDSSLAGFGSGNTTTAVYKVVIDAVPPRVTVLSPPGASGRKGSAAAVAYRLSEEVAETGVRVGEEFFPAYEQPGGAYFCMLAFPISMSTSEFVPEIYARDLAGNETRSRLLLPAQDRKFVTDTLNIDDNFLDTKMPAFAGLVPHATTNLERYIGMNNDIRVANEATLREVAKKTAPTMLWSETPFLRLPRSASRAGFGDARTYKYKGEVIDHQTHMGQDLASVRQAPVPAANDGVVVFADDLGIFGNLVIIDHGIGLMSLYSHLTDIHVHEGDTIKRGETLGTTGTTGLAGGDHLHFGMLVHGIQLQPLDWLDAKWIKNNITDRLTAR